MFHECVRIAQEILQLIEAFESEDPKYDLFKLNFLSREHNDNGIIYNIWKICDIQDYVFYSQRPNYCDYDDSKKYNYISFIPNKDVAIFEIFNDHEKIYSYDLFKDLSEELVFQYSTIYSDKELKMLILYWYFNKHYNSKFFINMIFFETVKQIYEENYEFVYTSDY